MTVALEHCLSRLTPKHRTALEWFIARAGREEPWPQPLDDGTLLATRAKGVYKPEWSNYALSVRQTLDSPYADREPEARSDGTWTYVYHQEGTESSFRDDLFTNRGLLECLHGVVPVGVLRQVTERPKPTYTVLGVALVSGWDGGFFFLEGFSPSGQARDPGRNTEIHNQLALGTRRAMQLGVFDPGSVIDGREHVMTSIVYRRGQPAFRTQLLDLYDGKCALSDCNVEEVLEAAHIVPYMGPATNHPSNGLLLRGDLHTLFDLGLIAIDAAALRPRIDRTLIGTPYQVLAESQLRLPKNPQMRPSREALERHRAWSGL